MCGGNIDSALKQLFSCFQWDISFTSSNLTYVKSKGQSEIWKTGGGGGGGGAKGVSNVSL